MVFYGVFGVGLRFFLLKQTKRLDAEFKYLTILIDLPKGKTMQKFRKRR